MGLLVAAIEDEATIPTSLQERKNKAIAPANTSHFWFQWANASQVT